MPARTVIRRPSASKPQPANDPGFVVIEWKPYENKTMRAFLALQLPSGMIIRGCSLHERDGSRWLGMPSREFPKADGSKGWAPIVEFASKESREKFQAAALAAVGRYLAEDAL